MVKYLDPYEKSPYWELENIEKSKRIVDSLSRLSSEQRNLLFKELLNSRIKVKGKDTIGEIETFEGLESVTDGSTSVKRKTIPFDKKENPQEVRKCFRTKIYKMRMNEKTSSTLRSWTDDVRYIYNAVVAYLKGKCHKIAGKEMTDIRNFFTVRKNNVNQKDPIIIRIMKALPQKVTEEACFEAIRAHNLSLLKKSCRNPEHKAICQNIVKAKRELKALKPRLDQKKALCESKIEDLVKSLKEIPRMIEKTSNVKFRLKKSPYATLTMPASSAKTLTGGFLRFYPSKFAPIKVNGLKKIPEHGFKLRWHRRTNSWHMHVSEEIRVDEASKSSRMCVVDPGVRVPFTCIDFEKEGNPSPFLLGEGWYTPEIKKRIKRIRKYASVDVTGKSFAFKSKREQKRLLRLKRTVELDRRKILNIVNDMHKKLARIILDKYDIIILPLLDTKSIVKKGGNIDKMTKYKTSLLAHGRFFHYLRWKALAMGKVVINQNESYTTKTCYTCGTLTDIGGSETYKCCNNQCGNICDRDFNSCFNIMSRYMSDYQSLLV